MDNIKQAIINNQFPNIEVIHITEAKPKPRSISTIASEIMRTWKKVNFAAKPYLHAMLQIDSITSQYGMDDARSIVLYFLSNASSWRGEDAKRIKAELKAML